MEVESEETERKEGCREQETDLVEDVEDNGELDLVEGDDDDELRDSFDDSTSDYIHLKIHINKRKYECSLDVRKTIP